jgi:hypothetical protein
MKICTRLLDIKVNIVDMPLISKLFYIFNSSQNMSGIRYLSRELVKTILKPIHVNECPRSTLKLMNQCNPNQNSSICEEAGHEEDSAIYMERTEL